jgi:DNA-binding IclR family transcriptional regulator
MSFDRRNERRELLPAEAGVRSVEAALRLLELLACNVGPLRVTDLAQRLDLGKPRVCRHLATLEAMGLVRRIGRQGYGVGERLTRMAHHVLRERTLAETARPLLQALRDELQQTVTLSAPGAGGAVVLDCFESPQAAAIVVRAGTLLRYPHSPAARLAVALGAATFDPGQDRQAAEEAMARWRERGVDHEVDTQHTGLGGVAAPIFAGQLLVGLVSVVVSSRLLMPQLPGRMVDALRRSVVAIEQGLGGN